MPAVHEKTNNLGSDTNRAVWAVQSQKQARSLKFWIYGEEELHYPCSENKGAETSYYEAYLRLKMFSHMQVVGFPMRRLIYQMIMGHILYQKLTFLMSFPHENLVSESCLNLSNFFLEIC